uniref:Uncharacterized protein n=1 Tax=Romanomermis culicivorax TaxID=13658 RepID=A0A915L809_ROMCU
MRDKHENRKVRNARSQRDLSIGTQFVAFLKKIFLFVLKSQCLGVVKHIKDEAEPSALQADVLGLLSKLKRLLLYMKHGLAGRCKNMK